MPHKGSEARRSCRTKPDLSSMESVTDLQPAHLVADPVGAGRSAASPGTPADHTRAIDRTSPAPFEPDPARRPTTTPAGTARPDSRPALRETVDFVIDLATDDAGVAEGMIPDLARRHAPEPTAGPGRAQAVAALLDAALLVGVTTRAHRDAVDYAQAKARPIKHSSFTRSVDDPFVQQAVGTISSWAFVAGARVRQVADQLDGATRTGIGSPRVDPNGACPNGTDPTPEQEAGDAFEIAGRAALRAAELVFDVGGGSSALRQHGLDRHRTFARHFVSSRRSAHRPADRDPREAVRPHTRTSGSPTSGANR